MQTLPFEIVHHMATFCTWRSMANMAQLNKHYFSAMMQHCDAFKLKYLLHAFYLNPENTLITHLYLPNLHFVQENCYELQTWILQPELDEEAHAIVPTLVTKAVAYIPQEQVEQAEAIFIVLLRYLPWQPFTLVKHPYAGICKMAQTGMQIAKLVGNVKLQEIMQIVPNFEDYATCAIYDEDAMERDLLFGVLLTMEMETLEINEKIALTMARVGFIEAAHSSAVTFTHPEIVQFILRKKRLLDMIDASLLNNIAFLRQAILIQPIVLKYAAAALQDNDALVAYAMENHKCSAVILYASYRLQCQHKPAFIRAIYRYGSKAQLPMEWNDDELVVQAYIQCLGGNFRVASVRLQQTFKCALLAIQNGASVYATLTPELQANKHIIRAWLDRSHANIFQIDTELIQVSTELTKLHQEALLQQQVLGSSRAGDIRLNPHILNQFCAKTK